MEIKFSTLIAMGLILAIVTIGAYWLFFDQEIYPSDCSEEGCRGGYNCLKSNEGDMCVEQSFFNNFWTINNLYDYDSCKMVIQGKRNMTGINLNFFIVTMKECDLLQWSCEHPERYDADCSWDDGYNLCVCNTLPWSGNKQSEAEE